MSPPEAATRTDKRSRRMRALVVAALGLLLVSALLLVSSRWPFGKSAPPEPVRLALSSTPHAALLHIAAAKGFFAEEGLDVTTVPVARLDSVRSSTRRWQPLITCSRSAMGVSSPWTTQ